MKGLVPRIDRLGVFKYTKKGYVFTCAPTMPLPPKKFLVYMCIEPPLPCTLPWSRPQNDEKSIYSFIEDRQTVKKRMKNDLRIDESHMHIYLVELRSSINLNNFVASQRRFGCWSFFKLMKLVVLKNIQTSR
uniref:Uncharacterized protein n=1 Tax=Romanomermis culicivorax TaxID=13658 RepID=A0A915JPD4_ROMCU